MGDRVGPTLENRRYNVLCEEETSSPGQQEKCEEVMLFRWIVIKEKARVDAKLPPCCDAFWNSKLHLPPGPSGLPGTSDERCAQASTSHSDIPSSSTTRCWLTCCCTLATRSDGPAGVAVGSAGSHTRDRAISGASVEEVMRSPQGLTSRIRSTREPGSISSLTGVTVT